MSKPLNHVYSKKTMPQEGNIRELRIKPMPKRISKEKIQRVAKNHSVSFEEARLALKLFDGNEEKADQILELISANNPDETEQYHIFGEEE